MSLTNVSLFFYLLFVFWAFSLSFVSTHGYRWWELIVAYYDLCAALCMDLEAREVNKGVFSTQFSLSHTHTHSLSH